MIGSAETGSHELRPLPPPKLALRDRRHHTQVVRMTVDATLDVTADDVFVFEFYKSYKLYEKPTTARTSETADADIR